MSYVTREKEREDLKNLIREKMKTDGLGETILTALAGFGENRISWVRSVVRMENEKVSNHLDLFRFCAAMGLVKKVSNRILNFFEVRTNIDAILAIPECEAEWKEIRELRKQYVRRSRQEHWPEQLEKILERARSRESRLEPTTKKFSELITKACATKSWEGG